MPTLITGATGLIGRRLTARCEHPVALSRNPQSAQRLLGDTPCHRWDPSSEQPPDAALNGVDTVFHLLGESVASGRWTKAKKRRIFDSRVKSTKHLVSSIVDRQDRPKTLVCASAVGFYGDRKDATLTESDAAGSGFLSEVCTAWEHEALKAQEAGIRVVCARIGIVLATDGGALSRMVPPFKLGAGGRLGHGKQWMAWIHIDDVVGILEQCATDEHLSGPVNVVAPEPARNAEFTRQLGRVLRRPALVPVPPFALRTVFGELGSVLMASQRVLPQAALDQGYTFAFPELGPALDDLLGPQGRTANR